MMKKTLGLCLLMASAYSQAQSLDCAVYRRPDQPVVVVGKATVLPNRAEEIILPDHQIIKIVINSDFLDINLFADVTSTVVGPAISGAVVYLRNAAENGSVREAIVRVPGYTVRCAEPGR